MTGRADVQVFVGPLVANRPPSATVCGSSIGFRLEVLDECFTAGECVPEVLETVSHAVVELANSHHGGGGGGGGGGVFENERL